MPLPPPPPPVPQHDHPDCHHAAPPGGLDVGWPDYPRLLASTASLPAELLRTTYLVDTGTQITLVCNTDLLTNLQPLDRPLAWASAAQGQSQQATHRGTLTPPLVAQDGSTHTFQLHGVCYAEHARLNAVAPTDLLRAGVTFKLHSNEPKECVVTFLAHGHYKRDQPLEEEDQIAAPVLECGHPAGGRAVLIHACVGQHRRRLAKSRREENVQALKTPVFSWFIPQLHVTSYGQIRLYTYGFTPITISQLGFTPSQITTASMSFGVPLPESGSLSSLRRSLPTHTTHM